MRVRVCASASVSASASASASVSVFCVGSRDRKLKVWGLNWDDFADSKEIEDLKLGQTLQSTSPAVGPMRRDSAFATDDRRETSPGHETSSCIGMEVQVATPKVQRSAPRPTTRSAAPPTSSELSTSAKDYHKSFDAERLRAENDALKKEIERLKHGLTMAQENLSDEQRKRESIQGAFDRLEKIYHSSMDDAFRAGLKDGEVRAREELNAEWMEIQRQRGIADQVLTLLLCLAMPQRLCSVSLKHKLLTQISRLRASLKRNES